MAIGAPGAAKVTARFGLHPSLRGDALPFGLAVDTVRPARLLAAFALEQEYAVDGSASVHECRQVRAADLRNLSVVLQRDVIVGAVPANLEMCPVHSAALADAIDVIADARGVGGVAAWEQRAAAGDASPGVFEVIVPRQSLPAPHAAWEVRPLHRASDWTQWSAFKAAVGGVLPVGAAVRIPATRPLPIAFDAYGRENRIHRGSPFRFDLRPVMAREDSAAWDLLRPGLAAPGTAAYWESRRLYGEPLRSLGNAPAPRTGLAAAQWRLRAGSGKRLSGVYKVALREYVRDFAAFASAWASVRTPNAAYRYGPGGIYGYWARPWIGLAARHDAVRDGMRGVLSTCWNIRITAAQSLRGAIWDGFRHGPPSDRLFASIGRRRVPGRGTRRRVGLRPFGAMAERLAANHHALCPTGVRLVARDTAAGTELDLGFIPEEGLDEAAHGVLADVALPDGEYAIEAQSSSFFWPDARTGTAPIYRLEAGAAPQIQLPAVADLHAELTRDGWRRLAWSAAGDAADAPFAFGIWFGAVSPTDLSGDPAVAIPRTAGLEHYEHFFQQTVPIHTAVAVFNAAASGRPAELFLDWNDARPDAPAHQWTVENRQERPAED